MPAFYRVDPLYFICFLNIGAQFIGELPNKRCIYYLIFVHWYKSTKLNRFKNKDTTLRVTVAEWLRRRTANPLGFSRAGSNPVSYDLYYIRMLI